MPSLFTSNRPPVRDPSLANAVAVTLIDRLRDVTRENFERALWIGGGDHSTLPILKTIGTLDQRPYPVEGENECFPYDDGTFDLIITNGTLNVVNDLPGALVQMRRALKPDGLFLAAMPGGETLYELRECITETETQLRGGAAARVHPMVDLQTMAGLMQRAGFALPVVDSDIKEVFYQNLVTLLHDIKNAGEGLSLTDRSRGFVGRDFWNAVEALYQQRHVDADGLLKTSFEILYAIGWGPSATQQQPLKPGSAETRLADALGAQEEALPDTTKPY